MSNTQHIFIDKIKIPELQRLQASLDELGYDLKLESFDSSGFTPCVLDCDQSAGFEISYNDAKDFIEEGGCFSVLGSTHDCCISLSWGGSFADCAAVGIVCLAFVKYFDASVTFDGEEQETVESLRSTIESSFIEILKEDVSQTPENPYVTDEQIESIYEDTIASFKGLSVKTTKRNGIEIRIEFSNGDWINSPKCELPASGIEGAIVDSVVQKKSSLVISLQDLGVLECHRAKNPSYQFTYIYNTIFSAKYGAIFGIDWTGPSIVEYIGT